jgi:hypothetical protein
VLEQFGGVAARLSFAEPVIPVILNLLLDRQLGLS